MTEATAPDGAHAPGTQPMGTLWGVGVGPGDPELLTLKAVKALNRAHVVFAAASTKNDYSLALSIASPHRITSYNVCYTKLLRRRKVGYSATMRSIRSSSALS